MKKYIIVGICLMSLYGCRKDGTPITINIKFFDYYSSQPISGFKVFLTKHKVLDLFGPTIVIDTLTTDRNGIITYPLVSSNDYTYFLTPSKDTNYCKFDNIDVSIGGKTNSQALKLKKYISLKVNLIDTSQIYQTFELRFAQNTAAYGNYSGNAYGNCKDTTIIFSKCIPDQNTDIYLDLSKGPMLSLIHINREIYISKTNTFQTTIKY